MNDVYRLLGQLRHYAWGGQGFITDLFGLPEQDQPVAEYWLGAHSAAPSSLLIPEQDAVPMNHWLNQQHSSLPYLLKVLDVARPLSIQVHPNRQQAEQGYALEDRMGIPLNSPRRNYKDQNPKPELALALGDFYLLYGFLPDQALGQALDRHASLGPLRACYQEGGLSRLFPSIIDSTQSQREQWLEPIYQSLDEVADRHHVDYWIGHWQQLSRTASERYDTGVLCMLIMNLVHLRSGEAIFQDSNVPHAYLHGRCVEAMANSDNVVRCGLTSKHVDVAAMQSLVSLEQKRPAIIRTEPSSSHADYVVPVSDFRLQRWRLDAGQTKLSPIQGQSILLTLQGTGAVRRDNAIMDLEQGSAIYLHQSQSLCVDAALGNSLDVLILSPG